MIVNTITMAKGGPLSRLPGAGAAHRADPHGGDGALPGPGRRHDDDAGRIYIYIYIYMYIYITHVYIYIYIHT